MSSCIVGCWQEKNVTACVGGEAKHERNLILVDCYLVFQLLRLVLIQ
jgi:hypothetical protein